MLNLEIKLDNTKVQLNNTRVDFNNTVQLKWAWSVCTKLSHAGSDRPADEDGVISGLFMIVQSQRSTGVSQNAHCTV